MAVSYDGDGNRVLQINLRSKNKSYPYGQDEDELLAALEYDEEEEDEERPAPAISPEETPEQPEVLPLSAGPHVTGQLNAFLYGVISYLKVLFMPLTPLSSAVEKEMLNPEKSWYRETAVTADQKTSDAMRIEAMGLAEDEEMAIKWARIPDVYTGYRYGDTYELTRYVNDVNRQHTEVLMEYTAAETVKTKYTYGLERLSTSNAAASGARGQMVNASYIPAGNGSVSSLMSGGSALLSYGYGPFGETIASAITEGCAAATYSIEESFYAYNSESFDPLTGLQYLRARYYDPLMGRFHVADTYPGSLYSPLSQNLYSYVLNDPINFIDPSGHYVTAANVKKAQNMIPQAISYSDVRKANVIAASVLIPQAITPTVLNRAIGYRSPAVSNLIAAQASVPHAISYADIWTKQLQERVNKPYCTTANKIQSGGLTSIVDASKATLLYGQAETQATAMQKLPAENQTNDVSARIIYGPNYNNMKTLNYDLRATLNSNLPETMPETKGTWKEVREAKDENIWYLYRPEDSALHQEPGKPEYIKVGQPDGREAVYNSDTKELITDPRYKGTYNYVNPEGVFGRIGHAIIDILPYYLFGGQG